MEVAMSTKSPRYKHKRKTGAQTYVNRSTMELQRLLKNPKLEKQARVRIETIIEQREIESGYYVVTDQHLRVIYRYANQAGNFGLKGGDARNFENYVNCVLLQEANHVEEI